MSAIPALDHSARAHRYSCPKCSGQTLRTWRRPIDRFLSGFVPVQRFRCQTFRCRWEGNIRVGREAFVVQESQGQSLSSSGDARNADLPWSFVVATSVALAGVITVVVMALEMRPPV